MTKEGKGTGGEDQEGERGERGSRRLSERK